MRSDRYHAFRAGVDLNGVEFPRLHEYFGEWAMFEERFRGLLSMARQTNWQEHVQLHGDEERTRLDERIKVFNGGPAAGAVLVIPVTGILMKQRSSMTESTSQVDLKRAIRAARQDGEVGAIVLDVESPGGTVSGTFEVVDELFAFAGEKPVIAFARDLMASAAYAIGSQATRVYANVNTALIGSIGTILELYDYSEAFQEMGVEAIPIATGALKSTGMIGAPVTDEQRAYLRDRVARLQESFDEAVQRGRGFSDEQLQAVRSGAVWAAKQAQQLGLIDGVKSFEEVIGEAIELAAAARTERNRINPANPNQRQDLAMSRTRTAKAKTASTSQETTSPAEAPAAHSEEGAEAAASQQQTEPQPTLGPENTAPDTTAAQPPAGAPESPDAAGDAPVAATLAELKTALPKSDAEFRESCLEQSLTLEQAKDRWLDRVEERNAALEKQLQTTKDAAEQLRGHEGVDAQVEGSKTDKKAERYEGALGKGLARFAAGYTIPGAEPTPN